MTHYKWAVASDILQEVVILLVTLFCGFTFLSSERLFGTRQGAKPSKKQPTKRGTSPPATSGTRQAGSNAAAAGREASSAAAGHVRLARDACDVSPLQQHYVQQQQQHAVQQQLPPLTKLSATARHVDEIVQRSNSTRSPEEGLALYADMSAKGMLRDVKDWTEEELGRHTVLDFFNAVIKSASLTCQPGLAVKVMEDMDDMGIHVPLELYDTTIRILAGKKHFRGAIAVYDRMAAKNVEPTGVMLSCLTSFAAELGEWSRMLEFFDKLSNIETPSIRAYMTVLRAHAKRGDWMNSKLVFQDMQRRNVHMDSLVLNAVLSTGVTLDHIEDAEELFEAAVRINPNLGDIVSYNTLLKGYAKRHDALRAQRLLVRMQELEVRPNAISFNTTIDAAVRSSRCDDAWALLEQMKSSGVEPDKFTCSILVKSFYENRGTTAKQVHMVLDMALKVHGDLPLLGNLYRGILEAASKMRDIALLQRVFAQMKRQGVQASLVEAPGPVGPTRRQRGLQGRAFRAGPVLRTPLHMCADSLRFNDALELLETGLSLGIVAPSESVEYVLQAAARQSSDSRSQAYDRILALADKHGLR
eukprot:gnl/TRDRNA2_/TRDRNA2_171065_c0_seq4.p1 gnl/TRDRNA2_/TRDRNA2_171065_c0~~gnl/TRDRNA2_/TRDRNA2_171065_c0_seq4.p1  ORF type:complete len:639 (+),score=124.54 gnl/TRDRNA2_/TRDRNA2_171065_c0_seq4:161-1918(+)